MAIEALGTPVSVSAFRTIASTFSRSAVEIGGGACACGSEAASKTKTRTARGFPGRGRRFMEYSSETGTVYDLGFAFWRPTACARLRSKTQASRIAGRNYNSDHVARRIQTQTAL